MIVIRIATEYSRTPGGRFKKDGPGSGEEFRQRFLEPLFDAGSEKEAVTIDLDGAFGYATSFLEEAFGGLVRKYSDIDVESRLRFVSNDEPLLVDEIQTYIRDARRKVG